MDSNRTIEFSEASRIPFLTEEENIEIFTRCIVREDFGKVFGASEAASHTQALERVLFDTIYPCPGGRT